MQYTSQGLMAPEDLADHHALHDTGRNPDCSGHNDDGGFGGVPDHYYCSVAEVCPGEDLEPL